MLTEKFEMIVKERPSEETTYEYEYADYMMAIKRFH
jgi:predicted methyltransferase